MLFKLKEALSRRRLRQYEAAREIGISDTKLSRIICGRVEATQAEKRALAKLVGARVEDLFGDLASTRSGEPT